MPALLEVKGATKRFGGLLAVKDVDMEVHAGETVGVIGPNGAGKTTLFNCISGFYHVTSGRIVFDGHDVTHLRADVICRLGVTRTFQIVRSLSGMTVLENVMVGAFKNTRNPAVARKFALEAIEFCGMADLKDAAVEELTVAKKKRLEMARAVATSPRLLMLDEVMAGLNPTERKEAVELIRRVRELGITVLMIEHVMDVIMPISDRLVVLNYGEKIAEGTPSEISRNEGVLTAYLGAKYRAKAK